MQWTIIGGVISGEAEELARSLYFCVQSLRRDCGLCQFALSA